ncbi:MAG: hypothetical protein HWN66_15140 [Candidatus Helarchaeota archaeon]|nr:hypothetical protein [Candidatus Helarchaeota archaeon]
MSEKGIKRKYILWTGAGLLGFTVVFAVLVLTGVITPVIFPPTGEPLDVSPLSSAFVTFLMLIILIYVGTRVLDFGLKYSNEDNESKTPK